MTEDSRPDAEAETLSLPPFDEGRAERLEIRDFVEPTIVADPRVNLTAMFRYPNEGSVCWYCGIVEALGWFAGTLIIHVMGGIFVAVGLFLIVAVATGKMPQITNDPKLLMGVTAGEMCLFVLAALLAFSIRYWGRALKELNLTAPDPRHVVIVVCGTLPLSFCVSAWSMPIQGGWRYLVSQFPLLEILDGMNTMEVVQQMAQATPLAVMILVVAVLPAIGEELVFRGAIGRILIANLGLWGGVFLTSFLFGWIHIHPVHALAVLPLGFAIHLIYLATRSFWMPVLLHFLNNSWASYSAQSNAGDPVKNGTDLTLLEGIEITSAFFAVFFLAMALWQSRVRLFHAEGSEWKSERFPLRVPAPTDVYRKAAPVNLLCWVAAVACVIVCHLTVAVDLWRHAAPANEDGIQVRTNQHKCLSFQADIEIVS